MSNKADKLKFIEHAELGTEQETVITHNLTDLLRHGEGV